MPSNRWYIALIFQIWYAPIGYEELAGGLEPISNDEIFRMNNNLFSLPLYKNAFDLEVKSTYPASIPSVATP